MRVFDVAGVHYHFACVVDIACSHKHGVSLGVAKEIDTPIWENKRQSIRKWLRKNELRFNYKSTCGVDIAEFLPFRHWGKPLREPLSTVELGFDDISFVLLDITPLSVSRFSWRGHFQ